MIIGIPTLVPPFLLFQNAIRFDITDHSWCQQLLVPFIEHRVYCHLLKIVFHTIKHNDPLPLYEYFYFCFYRPYHVRHSIRWLIRNTTTSLLLPHLISSHLIWSYLILSYLIWSHLILSDLMRWDEIRSDQIRSDEMRRDEMRWDKMRWDEMR